jgi:hypothetical protein
MCKSDYIKAYEGGKKCCEKEWFRQLGEIISEVPELVKWHEYVRYWSGKIQLGSGTNATACSGEAVVLAAFDVLMACALRRSKGDPNGPPQAASVSTVTATRGVGLGAPTTQERIIRGIILLGTKYYTTGPSGKGLTIPKDDVFVLQCRSEWRFEHLSSVATAAFRTYWSSNPSFRESHTPLPNNVSIGEDRLIDMLGLLCDIPSGTKRILGIHLLPIAGQDDLDLLLRIGLPITTIIFRIINPANEATQGWHKGSRMCRKFDGWGSTEEANPDSDERGSTRGPSIAVETPILSTPTRPTVVSWRPPPDILSVSTFNPNEQMEGLDDDSDFDESEFQCCSDFNTIC